MRTMQATRRLLVTRQHPETRHYTRLGELQQVATGGYRFKYEDAVTRPLPGLSLGKDHFSEELFSVFAERVIHPQRPDHAASLIHLGLDLDAGPFEVLAVSGGRRTGDAYELTPVPEPGAVELPFLVHGVRHLSDEGREAVDALSQGQRLKLVHEPDNIVSDRALVVTDREVPLGYVPDPLLEYVHEIIAGKHELVVERVNPASAGFHMRLLVTLRGYYQLH